MSSNGGWVRVLLVVGIVLLAPGFASAQATTGEITGRVLDSADLGVPGATVTAINQATGSSRSAVTGAEGDYTIPSCHRAATR